MFYENNKQRIIEGTKTYKKNNLEWYQKYNQEYYGKNTTRMKANSKKSFYKRIETDVGFKLCVRYRTRVYKALKGILKEKHTLELIGCSIPFLKNYLEKQFQSGMNWDNYGKWHVDHIVPCASFDFTKPEDQHRCFHYTNLQPWWAIDNIRKSDKTG